MSSTLNVLSIARLPCHCCEKCVEECGRSPYICRKSHPTQDRPPLLPLFAAGVGYYRKSVLPKKRKEPRGTPGLACRLLSDELTSSLTASYAVQALPSVALGHGWVVFSKDGSEYAQFTHAPLALCNLISGRRQQRQPAPRLVSLGPDDNFFVQFSDGEWRLSAGAPPALREALLRNGERPVRCIAFDPHGVGYFVLWDDGLSVWDDLPLGLHNLLNSRQRSLPGVEHVAMGPRGEFFVRFVGGAWRLGDCCDPEQWDFVQGLKSRGCEVLRCTFGQEGSWAVEYA